MVCSIRNDLERGLRKINEIIEYVDCEQFKNDIQTYPYWIGKNKPHLKIKIDRIVFERNAINWHCTEQEYPKGSCGFSSFREHFYPIYDK